MPPKKPFANYKWRWASVAPTESLNDPPVYLGVLRVLRRFEGVPPNDLGLAAALDVVKRD